MPGDSNHMHDGTLPLPCSFVLIVNDSIGSHSQSSLVFKDGVEAQRMFQETAFPGRETGKCYQ